MTARPAVAYIDGGARGNPGPAGYGVRIEDAAGHLIAELHEPVGPATNNVAEYHGLLAALRYAVEHGLGRLHVRSDSLLLVMQMLGKYRVRHPGLRPLHEQAAALAARLDRVTFEHVPREANAEADRLANLAMDEAERRPSARPPTRPPGPPRLPFSEDE